MNMKNLILAIALIIPLSGFSAPAPPAPPTKDWSKKKRVVLKTPKAGSVMVNATMVRSASLSLATVAPATQTFTAAWDCPGWDTNPVGPLCKSVLYWSPQSYGNGQWREVGRYAYTVRRATVTVPRIGQGQFGIGMVVVP